MSYWNQILSEVLNKHDPLCAVKLTNVKDYTQLEIQPNEKPSRIKKPILSKQLVKKKVRLPGEIRKYRLGEKFQNIYFTRREAQVAFCCMRGKSTLQIAKLLKLSRRTIEFYINNMKVKLNCRFKSELLAMILQSDFLSYVDAYLETSCNITA